MSSTGGNPLIVFVDHDDSIHKMISDLGATISTATMRRLDDLFEFRTVVVPPGDDAGPLAVKEVAPLLNAARETLILIDLSFKVSPGPEDVHLGRGIARYVRAHTPDARVGVFTRYPVNSLFAAQISADRFSLVLTGMRDMCDGAPPIPGRDWQDLLIGAFQNNEAASPIPFSGSVDWAPGHPLFRSRSFSQGVPSLVRRALVWLKPAPPEITLTQLSGGFSGSFVIKAAARDQKTFVLKIDDDPDQILRELEGYRTIQSLLPHSCFLPLVGPDSGRAVIDPATPWTCFVMECEEKALPLLTCADRPDCDLPDIYRTLFTKILSRLHRRISVSDIIVSAVLDQARASAQTGLLQIQRYTQRLTVPSTREGEWVDAVAAFCENPSLYAGLCPPSLLAPSAELVHGDLNCRNVLFDPQSRNIRLIDFPHVGQTNCLAIDFVKAETELILIILDWTTGSDCDFDRIRSWGEATAALSTTMIPDAPSTLRPELEVVWRSIEVIRECYVAAAAGQGAPSQSYRLLLLARVLRYVEYTDLTPVKRCLAAVWAGQLLRSIQASPGSWS